MRNKDLQKAGWGPLRWPFERRWIRRAEALVDRELARWIEAPAAADPATSGPEAPEPGTAEPDPDGPVAEGAEKS